MKLATRASVLLAIALAILGCRAQTSDAIDTKRTALSEPPTEITYIQVYASADGETHFREVSVPLTRLATRPPAQPVAQSALQPATTIRHAAFEAHWGVYDRDHNVFHTPSDGRFVTFRSGVTWIRTSDSETRQFRAGDVVEVLDVAPSKGHIAWVGDEPAIMLYSNHP